MFNHILNPLTRRDFAPPGSRACSVVGTIAHHQTNRKNQVVSYLQQRRMVMSEVVLGSEKSFSKPFFSQSETLGFSQLCL
ncbi:hypothetical protein FGO68_gene7496 [Halteria grandinella]|uniref:Uncharacterized protein n=1 Tax=Halteria grandinella TaxID=5974 RepID=A0A8J8T755_HALGN|nr:hypothetical protein FGO68_gene7496 [Halteria grandinella]